MKRTRMHRAAIVVDLFVRVQTQWTCWRRGWDGIKKVENGSPPNGSPRLPLQLAMCTAFGPKDRGATLPPQWLLPIIAKTHAPVFPSQWSRLPTSDSLRSIRHWTRTEQHRIETRNRRNHQNAQTQSPVGQRHVKTRRLGAGKGVAIDKLSGRQEVPLSDRISKAGVHSACRCCCV